MTSVEEVPPRERILQATLRLLEAGGVGAVSTRAVSGAAGVQVPTIYRQFGDMQGLLGAVAQAGADAYLRQKLEQVMSGDPLQDLRAGWDRHVRFGLDHPHLYLLMYSAQMGNVQMGGGEVPGAGGAAAQQAGALLRALLVQVAGAGRLALSVDRAAALIHAAGVGVTLSLIGVPGSATPPGQAGLAPLMRETVFRTILTPGPEAGSPGAGSGASGAPPRQRAAGHAAALDALLPGLDAPFSPPERALLSEWLQRLG